MGKDRQAPLVRNTANWDLANTKEQIDRSVPTSTLYSILDDLLHQALYPFYSQTKIFKRYLAQFLVYGNLDKRRKISPKSPEFINALIMKQLYHNDDNLNFRDLDRGLLYDLANMLVAEIEPIKDLEVKIAKGNQNALLDRRALSLRIGCDEDTLFPLYNWSSSHLDLFVQFRDKIVGRYHRLAYHQANKIYFTRSKKIDPTELFKNLLLSTLKAVEKCNPEKGSLTSYVQQHFLNAQFYPDFKHHYSVAYDVPNRVHSDNSNSVIPLDDDVINELEHDEGNPTIMDQNLAKFLRSLPGVEIAMLMLNVPFALTDAEIARLSGFQKAVNKS